MRLSVQKEKSFLKLVADDGRAVEQEKRSLITNYYKKLFRSIVGNRVDELLQYVQPKETHEMKSALLEFTAEEIKKGLDSIGDVTLFVE